MKIVVISPFSLLSDHGGQVLYAQQSVNAWTRAGHQVTHLAIVQGQNGAPEVTAASFQELRINTTNSRAVARFRSTCSTYPSFVLEYKSRGLRNMMSEQLQRLSPDCVVYHHRRIAWMLACWPEARRFPSIYASHNDERLALEERARHSSSVLKPFAVRDSQKGIAFEFESCRRADHVTFISKFDQQGYNSYLDGEIASQSYIPYQIVPKPSQVEIREPIHRLILSGSFDWPPKQANAEWLANRIMPLVWKRNPHVKLQIVGKNADWLNIPQNDYIEIHSDVPSTELYFRTPGIAVAPERQRAGVKIKVLEAAANGFPLVSTTTACEGTPLVPGESVLTGDDEKSIADQILRLVSDPALCRSIRDTAREHLINFNRAYSSEDLWNFAVEEAIRVFKIKSLSGNIVTP